MLPGTAGRLTSNQTSVGSTLVVLTLLYIFWHVSKAWPGVAAIEGHVFSMQQVLVHSFSVILSSTAQHDSASFKTANYTA